MPIAARVPAVLCGLLTLACGLALEGCENPQGGYYGTTRPRHGPREVWTNLGAEPEWIDPGKCSDSSGGTVIVNLFAGLTQPHPKTLQPMPDIARGWDISGDGLVYTFRLREATWSDGTPLTAHDFEYSWKRVLDGKTASKYATFLYPVKNGEAFNTGKVDASAVGVRALDDLTLRVELENPLPYFLDLLMFYTTMPVPRHVLERLAREGKNPDLWTRVEHIVSNGPFRLADWKFRQYMVFERNARYWDTQSMRIDRVKLLMVESANTTLNLYEAGEIDYLGGASLPSEFLDHLSTYRDFQSGPYLGTYFLWVNTQREPMRDPRVRRALSLSIDRASLVKYVTRGGQIPWADLVPDGVGGYEGLQSPLFDPQAARQLLAEAGYGAKGKPLPKVVFRYNTSEGHKQVAEAVQQMWKKHLGVSVEIENQEWKVYLKTLKALDFQIARMGWIGDYADPYTFLELLSKGNGNNHSNWTLPQYDELLKQANRTRDRAARLLVLREAEQLLARDLPVIPLYVYTRSEVVKPYVMGHFLNYQHRMIFKHFWIDERWYAGVPNARLPNVPPPLLEPEPVAGQGAVEPRP